MDSSYQEIKETKGGDQYESADGIEHDNGIDRDDQCTNIDALGNRRASTDSQEITAKGKVWENSLYETLHGTINPLQNQAYLHYREIYFVGIVLQLAVMFSLVFITILKPWGEETRNYHKRMTN